MELITTVRDFVEEMKHRHISLETHIRVIIDEPKTTTTPMMKDDCIAPIMTQEEQIRLLNLLPNDYDPEASEELIYIIETSHTNNDILDL